MNFEIEKRKKELSDQILERSDKVLLIASSNYFDSPQIIELCNQINICLNQIEILDEILEAEKSVVSVNLN